MADKLKMATAFVSATALAACQNLAVVDHPPEETAVLPPEMVMASPATIARPPTASQWDSLGKYFEIVFAATPDLHKNWTFEGRQQSLANHYKDFQKKTGMDSVTACMPLNEAIMIVQSAELSNILHLSPEQKVHVQLTRDILNSPSGNALAREVSIYDPIMCVENNSAVYGRFYPNENIISYQLKNDCHGVDLTESILQNWPQYSRVFNTFLEELAHATQFHSMDIFQPSYDKNFRRDEEKTWNLSLEAHAKVIASIIAVENAANGRPEILHQFLASSTQFETDITKKVMEAYTLHGQDRIRQQPDLLADAFFAFFRDKSAILGYTDQGNTYFNRIDPENHNPIPMSQYIEAFGKLPNSEGNMLASSLHNKTQRDIVEMMPETPLKKWLTDSLVASSKGQNITDLPKNNHEQAIMSNCVNTASMPEPSSP